MRRCPHRINFRLTTEQFTRYGLMIGGMYGVQNWTDLCQKALLELSKRFKGPWNMPLDVPEFDRYGCPLEPRSPFGEMVSVFEGGGQDKQKVKPVSDRPTLAGVPGPGKNGKHASGRKKLPLKAKRKTG